MVAVGCAEPSDQEATSDAVALPEAAEAPGDLAALESPYVETPLQNEYVDVHHVTLPAGAAIAPHEGGTRVVYSLGAYTLRFETDGASETNTFEEGDIHYHESGVHAVENTGNEEANYVVFERREAALPTAQAEGDTDIATPGEGTADEIILDNEFAEVHRVTLQPRAQLPPHKGYARVIYSLSGYLLEFTGEDGTREQRFQAGEAHYHDPGDHTVENAGDSVAEFLVAEFKQ
jgi:hypothetical protein